MTWVDTTEWLVGANRDLGGWLDWLIVHQGNGFMVLKGFKCCKISISTFCQCPKTSNFEELW